jgi:hypothetical protein
LGLEQKGLAAAAEFERGPSGALERLFGDSDPSLL